MMAQDDAGPKTSRDIGARGDVQPLVANTAAMSPKLSANQLRPLLGRATTLPQT